MEWRFRTVFLPPRFSSQEWCHNESLWYVKRGNTLLLIKGYVQIKKINNSFITIYSVVIKACCVQWYGFYATLLQGYQPWCKFCKHYSRKLNSVSCTRKWPRKILLATLEAKTAWNEYGKRKTAFPPLNLFYLYIKVNRLICFLDFSLVQMV